MPDFDLGGYIAARLSRAGLRQIEDLQLCTYAEPARFFSFRRTTHRGEADYGRHINAIAWRIANSDWPALPFAIRHPLCR